jgi:hypothetical protein
MAEELSRMSMSIAEPVARALRIYVVKTTGSSKNQSKVIETALKEWLELKGEKIEATA